MAGSERLVIYHNPRCSKSRQALALIEAAGVEHDVVRYLDDPPSAARMRELLNALGLAPRELMRTKEAVYREQGLGDERLDDAALIAAMVAHPILIERPIVAKGKAACLGRPPENVSAFLTERGLSGGQS
jgi:arsenate reductase